MWLSTLTAHRESVTHSLLQHTGFATVTIPELTIGCLEQKLVDLWLRTSLSDQRKENLHHE